MVAKKPYKSEGYKPIVVLSFVILCILFIYCEINGFPFFWGLYMFFFIPFALFSFSIVVITFNWIRKRKNKKSKKNYKKDQKEKNGSGYKKLREYLFLIFLWIFVLATYIFFASKTILMTLDLPYVINHEYKKVNCIVEESRMGIHFQQAQYLIVRDVETKNVISIKFQHKYNQIFSRHKYTIEYLPHSKLGVEAELDD